MKCFCCKKNKATLVKSMDGKTVCYQAVCKSCEARTPRWKGIKRQKAFVLCNAMSKAFCSGAFSENKEGYDEMWAKIEFLGHKVVRNGERVEILSNTGFQQRESKSVIVDQDSIIFKWKDRHGVVSETMSKLRVLKGFADNLKTGWYHIETHGDATPFSSEILAMPMSKLKEIVDSVV